MAIFRTYSIKNKLVLINMVVTFSALFLAAILFLFYEYHVFKINLVGSLKVQTEIVGKNSTAALMFNDSQAAEETLSALRSSRNVLYAAIYKPDGSLLAEYKPGVWKEELIPRQIIKDGYVFGISRLDLFHAIYLDKEMIGSMRILSDLKGFYNVMLWHAVAVLAVLFISLLWAFFLLTRLQRKITDPILYLSRLMSVISRDRNYYQRASVTANDEIGDLAIVFNDMLEQIQVRDDELRKHRMDLEQEVEIQTLEIKKSNEMIQGSMEDLKKAKEAAESANIAKSQFIANMSHEIRTPLNGVLGLAELLLHTELTEKQKRNVDNILNSGSSLLGVINEILDFSKIEAGMMGIEIMEFDFRQTIIDVIETFSLFAGEKGVRITSSIPADLESQVNGDQARIRQILTNLVGNAVKYTERGEIIVKCMEKGGEEGLIDVRFEVSDTGIGIDLKDREKIFEPFSQADGSSTRKYGGTGLGLAISKQVIELMGGEIGVESEPGRGSTFWFRILFQKAEAPAVQTVPALTVKSTVNNSISSPAKFNARVLVVEDNSINQAVAKEMLKHFGLKVDVTVNGFEALDAMSKETYHLVFMDCQMPMMDGFEATARIREREMMGPVNPGPAHTPIIAVTAHAMKGYREKCLAAGMDDYISKPFNLEEVYLILDRWISDTKGQGGPLDPADSVSAPEQSERITVERKRLKEIRALQATGKEDLLERVLNLYMEDSLKLLADLREAVKNEDPEFIRKASHTFKSSSANVGAVSLSLLCGELEMKRRDDDMGRVEGLLADIEKEYERVEAALRNELKRTTA